MSYLSKAKANNNMGAFAETSPAPETPPPTPDQKQHSCLCTELCPRALPRVQDPGERGPAALTPAHVQDPVQTASFLFKHRFPEVPWPVQPWPRWRQLLAGQPAQISGPPPALLIAFCSCVSVEAAAAQRRVTPAPSTVSIVHAWEARRDPLGAKLLGGTGITVVPGQPWDFLPRGQCPARDPPTARPHG